MSEVIEIEIPLWKPKWNMLALRTHLERVGPAAFNRGLRNIALSSSDRTFPSFEKCIDTNRSWKEVVKDNFQIFSGVDLASSKKRKGNCIFTLAKDPQNHKYIPIDIRSGSWTGPKLLQEIRNVQKLFKPKSFLIENNALQNMVIDLFKSGVDGDISRPVIKRHFTGMNKLDADVGLPRLEVEFYNGSWIVCFGDKDHKANCKCGFCKFKNEVIGHPLYESTDILMAAWLAWTSARKGLIGRIRML
jgi:hypothetical protein